MKLSPIASFPGPISLGFSAIHCRFDKIHGDYAWLPKLILTVLLLATLMGGGLSARGQVSYWVSPTGTGNGSSSSTPASYISPSFWSGVQSELSSGSATVNFASGTYSAGSLNFTNMGNPLNRLVLTATTPQGAVFSLSSSFSYIVYLAGSQNIKLNGFIFTNNVAYWGVYCIQNGNLPTRNIEINNCWFLNLTNAYYAAIGLLNGVRSIQVLNCNFTNIMDPNGNHQHIIYSPHDNEDILVSNCISQDCLADYMRFRDDSDYVTVENSKFISTKSSTAWPFVSAELFNETNSDSAGDEFFGTYFQISGNTFDYLASGGPGPYSAMHFSDDSWSPQSYYCDLTSSQASTLGGGNQSYQQSFLATNMGIIGSDIKMFNNTYLGVSTYQMDYQYIHDDSTAPYNNWTGDVNLYNTPDTSGTPLAPTPVMRNSDFNRRGFLLTAITPGDDDYECLFRNWFCSPKYTDILLSTNFYGTNNALRFNTNDSQEVYQWITPPGTNWTMDCMFAIGTCFSGTRTLFKVNLFHNDITGSAVSVGVNSSGQFGIYNGGTFTVLPGLGTVAFSVDNTGDGTYTDPTDTLNVYHLRIVGNYSAATPYVNIYTSDANSLLLTNQVLGLTDWVGSSPVSGQSSPETVAFYNYTAPVLVGQVAITNGILLTYISEAPVLVSPLPAPSTNSVEVYAGETIPTLSLTVESQLPLHYQWFSNSVAIAGATNAQYTPPSLPASGLPSIGCIVSNTAGAVTSLWSVAEIPLPFASYPQAVLALNPVGYWRLNETPDNGTGNQGAICHDYVGGNDGVYSNVVLARPGYNPATDPTEGSARFGTYASSNSAASLIQNPDFSQPNGSNGEFSVTAWVVGDGSAQTINAGIVTKGYFYQEELDLDEGASGTDLRFEVRNAAGTAYNANSTVNLQTDTGWHFLAGVCDEANGNVSLYVDGALAGQTAIPALSGITNSSSDPLSIGARATSATSGYDNQFVGKINDVAIYNYALSSSQVQQLYTSSVPLMNLTSSNNNQVINYTGELLSSTNVAGPYTPVPGALPTSYVVPLTNSQMFYRVNNQ